VHDKGKKFESKAKVPEKEWLGGREARSGNRVLWFHEKATDRSANPCWARSVNGKDEVELEEGKGYWWPSRREVSQLLNVSVTGQTASITTGTLGGNSTEGCKSGNHRWGKGRKLRWSSKRGRLAKTPRGREPSKVQTQRVRLNTRQRMPTSVVCRRKKTIVGA